MDSAYICVLHEGGGWGVGVGVGARRAQGTRQRERDREKDRERERERAEGGAFVVSELGREGRGALSAKGSALR